MTTTNSSNSTYAGLRTVFAQYWKVYGGWKELRRSPYLHVSAVLALVMFGSWRSAEWWVHPLSVLPNLVGFSIAAFAIFLAVGGDEFQSFIAGVDEGSTKSSPYIQAAAAFSHFIVVQVLAIIFALVLAACYRVPLPTWAPDYLPAINDALRLIAWMAGYWLFLYALTLTLGTVMVIFRAAHWFDLYQTALRKGNTKK